MKNIKQWLFAAAGIVLLSSCADYLETNNYPVSRPGNSELYDYLNEYQPLKEYLDRSAHPDFKVSAALTASEFNNKGMVYALASGNFDEIVAGNAMKMGSIVSDEGAMDFGTVSSFVTAAEEAGLTVYGHTLAWHSQQPVKWLNKLIADIELPVDPSTGNQCLKMTTTGASENTWDYQLNYTLPTPLVTGKTYTLSLRAKATNGLESVPLWPCDAAGAVLYTGFGGLAAGDDMTTLTLSFTAEADYKYLQFALGKLDGDLYLDDIVLTEEGSTDNLVANGTFDEEVSLKDVGWQEDGGVPGNTWWKYSWVNFSVSMESIGGGGGVSIEWVNQLTNSEMAVGGSMDNFVVRESGKGDVPGTPLEGQGPDGMNCIKITSVDNPANTWDTQFFIYTPDKKWAAGEKYRISFWYKASQAASCETQCHGAPGSYMHWQMLPNNPSFTTEWQYYEAESTIPGEGDGMQAIAFNLNVSASATDYYFANIVWSIETKVVAPTTYWVNAISNSDMTGDDFSNFIVRSAGQGDTEGPGYPGEGPNGGSCVKIFSTDNPANSWDTQFFIYTPGKKWAAGEKYRISFDYKADSPASSESQCHGTPGSYMHWQMLPSNPSFTTEWQHYEAESTIPGEGDGMQSIAFNLNVSTTANTYYFANIVWEYEETSAGNTRPQSDEEKKDTLTMAMNKWISGMMAATQGKVKAWDLVNEAISGSGNVDGFYALQHGSADDATNFFWQDYLGDVDYVVIAEKAARQYFAENGGNPSELKLFINDYNLESTWDDNKKLRSLIYWIGKWEEAGAKIDGIGSQMHITYYIDAASQENQKKHVTQMLELMAATGKLVRISELDMGIADKQFGTNLKTSEVTFEQEQAMAEYYKWIIEEYFRVVPVAQQYGICQWCLTDANANSGWRAGEPVGLWTEDYLRKPAYAGWAEGLQNK
jgi:GH35 family endo-1,4-beta-xylanase